MPLGWDLDRGTVIAALAVLAVAIMVAASNNIFSTLSAGEQDMISYCGTPDWFDRYPDKYGYTPTSQCTSIQVADYRIDTEIREYYDGRRSCYAQWDVYNITADGDLDKIVSDHYSPRDGDLQLPGLEISKSGGRYDKNTCMWVSTSYDAQLPGKVSFTATGAPDAVRGQPATVTVHTQNQFHEPVNGTLSAKFCVPGPFGQDTCLTRQSAISVSAGGVTSTDFSVPTDRIYGNITVTPTLTAGVQRPAQWRGVNADCDNDGTIEPMSRCDRFALGSATGDALTVQVTEPETRPSRDEAVAVIIAEIHNELKGFLQWLGL
jgi:hypothetical protein